MDVRCSSRRLHQEAAVEELNEMEMSSIGVQSAEACCSSFLLQNCTSQLPSSRHSRIKNRDQNPPDTRCVIVGRRGWNDDVDKMAGQQRQRQRRPNPSGEAGDFNVDDTSTNTVPMVNYGSSSISNVLSPVDEERQSRPRPRPPPQAQAQAQTTGTAASPRGHQPLSSALEQQAAHHSPEMTQTHMSYQALAAGPPRTPPRSSAKKKSRKSKSSRRRGSASKSSSKRRRSVEITDRESGGGGGGGGVGGGVTGITSSIKRSLSQLSLFSGDDTGDDEETASRRSLAFGNPDDDDHTSAHHRAELYGAIGGPTGMIGAFGDRRGCKRILVLITLAFILLSVVLERIEERRDAKEQAMGGGSAGDNTGDKHKTSDPNITIGEIGELDPGKCRQIIDQQAMEVADATAKMDKMAAEIRRLERQVAVLQSKVQEDDEKGGKRDRRSR